MTCINFRFWSRPHVFFFQGLESEQMRLFLSRGQKTVFHAFSKSFSESSKLHTFFLVLTSGLGIGRTLSQVMTPRHGRETPQRQGKFMTCLNETTKLTDIFHIVSRFSHGSGCYSRGNIPIFRKSSHTMFSSYSRPGFWYVTLIGISAQSGGNSWPTANPLNAPPQLSIPYVVPKQLWTLNELKAALIRKFPHLSTEEGQGCQR